MVNTLWDQQEPPVSNKPSPARQAFGDIAPALATYTDDVLFGDVWKRQDLSPRDRSLVTVASLVALYHVNELPFHLDHPPGVLFRLACGQYGAPNRTDRVTYVQLEPLRGAPEDPSDLHPLR